MHLFGVVREQGRAVFINVDSGMRFHCDLTFEPSRGQWAQAGRISGRSAWLGHVLSSETHCRNLCIGSLFDPVPCGRDADMLGSGQNRVGLRCDPVWRLEVRWRLG